MIRAARLIPVIVLPVLLAGCVSTVATVVTAPIKVTGKAVNWATSGQARADRAYGRKMRKQEEREGRERHELAKRCRKNPDDVECGQLQAAPAR